MAGAEVRPVRFHEIGNQRGTPGPRPAVPESPPKDNRIERPQPPREERRPEIRTRLLPEALRRLEPSQARRLAPLYTEHPAQFYRAYAAARREQRVDALYFLRSIHTGLQVLEQLNAKTIHLDRAEEIILVYKIGERARTSGQVAGQLAVPSIFRFLSSRLLNFPGRNDSLLDIRKEAAFLCSLREGLQHAIKIYEGRMEALQRRAAQIRENTSVARATKKLERLLNENLHLQRLLDELARLIASINQPA